MVVREMDLDTAIDAHMQWKSTLRAALEHKHALDATFIAQDDQCELGKWLHGEAKVAWGATFTWSELAKRHAAFHLVAAEAARLINADQKAQAEAWLSGPEYQVASKQVVLAIIQLKRRVDGGTLVNTR